MVLAGEVVERDVALEDTMTVVEVPAAEGAMFSLFDRLPKIGLNTGAVVVGVEDVAVAAAGWLAGGVLSIPKRMLGLGVEGGLLGVGPSSSEVGTPKLLSLLPGWTREQGGANGTGKFNMGTSFESDAVTDNELEFSGTLEADNRGAAGTG